MGRYTWPQQKIRAVKTGALTDALIPPTYEQLVARLMREYPGHSQAQIEAAIREALERVKPKKS